MSVTVTSNIVDFRAQLRAIGADMEKKAVRQASQAAASVFRAAAQKAAPVQKPPSTRKGHVVGTLKRAIYSRRVKRTPRGTVAYRISIRQGKREQAKKRDAFYWVWVEQGHIARGPGQRIKGGANTRALQRKRIRGSGKGVVQPSPFLKPAFSSAGSKALQVFNDRMALAIAKYSQT